MLVIASSILRISPPTIRPMTRITSGSNRDVNRLMAVWCRLRRYRPCARTCDPACPSLLRRSQQVPRQRERTRRCSSSSDPSPRFTPLRHHFQRPHLPIIQDGRQKFRSTAPGHTVGHQRRHGPSEPRRFRLAHRIPEHRHGEQQRIPPQSPTGCFDVAPECGHKTNRCHTTAGSQ